MITQEQLDKFRWYHKYRFPGGAETKPQVKAEDIWRFIESCLKEEYFEGKIVLDTGSRDAYWAFMAERMGAKSVTAVEIIINPAVEQILIPEFQSKVQQIHMNAMDVASIGVTFDTVLCFGLLYHVRYPFKLLREFSKVMSMGGRLLIETAILDVPFVEQMPMLWCPVKQSPYEHTSCTFFNVEGLRETMEAFGFKQMFARKMGRVHHNKPNMDRAFLVFEKIKPMDATLEKYWDSKYA